jgi:hypothetical protein
MLKKAKLIMFFAIVFSLAFANSSLAKSDVANKNILKPSKNAEVVLDKVELIKENGRTKITIKDSGHASDGPKGYKITVDPENNTYKTIKASPEEIKEHTEGELDKSTTSAREEQSFGIASTTNEVNVKYHTEGPYYHAAQTVHMLRWNSDGRYAYTNFRSLSCNATHENWIKDECASTGYSRIDGGRTISSSMYGKYHSWKYYFDSQRTDLQHDITIEGYYTGSYNYYTSIYTSGEQDEELKSAVYVY